MSETQLKLKLVAKRMNAVSRPLRSELIGRNGYVTEAEESEDLDRRQVALLVAGSNWPELKRETPPNPGHVVRRSDVAIYRWKHRTGSIVEIFDCGVYGPGLCLDFLLSKVIPHQSLCEYNFYNTVGS